MVFAFYFGRDVLVNLFYFFDGFLFFITILTITFIWIRSRTIETWPNRYGILFYGSFFTQSPCFRRSHVQAWNIV